MALTGIPRTRRASAAGLAAGALLFGALAGASPGTGSTTGVSPGALQRLALSVQDGPEYARTDFAAIAIEEVIALHEFEYQRLAERGRVSRREAARQARWGSALRAFLDGLYTARDALAAAEPVQILVSPPAAVQVLVGARTVSLEPPRIDMPRQLDDAIVTAYCYHFGCDERIVHGDPLPPPARVQAARGAWSFGAGLGSIYETVDGLGFMFSDVHARARKEQACRQVRAELLRLAEALAAQRRAGRAVDFDALRLADGAGHDQLVIVSRTGPPLRMSLPGLAQVPGVVEVARGWLRAQVLGRDYRQLFPRADLLLAELL